MKSKAIIILSIICFFYTSAYSQKVKYKDLFILLNAKQYEQAEPFLKKYLKGNNDPENSALLFMAITYHEKTNKNDMLKQTETLILNIDSAILFYDKANKVMTEKEVSRNEEYYQAYNRRDLRTGKFGVKLSDIQFDIEKRVLGLKEKKENIKALKDFYVASETAYTLANNRFITIQNKYATETEFSVSSAEKFHAPF